MRELSVKRIEDIVYALFMSACCEIGEDVLSLLQKSLEMEESPFRREVLRQLIENDRIAAEKRCRFVRIPAWPSSSWTWDRMCI